VVLDPAQREAIKDLISEALDKAQRLEAEYAEVWQTPFGKQQQT